MAKKLIKVEGLNKAGIFLNKKGKKAISLAEDGVETSTLFIVDEIKASISGNRAEPKSVDSGEFKDSIRGESSGLIGKASSDVKQSKFMEFGTSKTPARKHFRNSIERSRNKVKDIIENEVNRL